MIFHRDPPKPTSDGAPAGTTLTGDDLLRRARRLEIKSRRIVSLARAGEYRSVFRGTGVEFESVREYVYGDDVRGIDWNVTARAGRPFVKQFVESRERSVLLAVDRSASMDFGSVDVTKIDVAVELCAVLSMTAANHRDRVGLAQFTASVEQYIRPSRGSEWTRRIVSELLRFQRRSVRSNLADVLADLERRLVRRQVVFLVSDFHEPVPVEALARLRRRHEVIAVAVGDRRETRLDGEGLLECRDPETGARFLLDAGSGAERQAFQRRASRERLKRRDELRQAGVERIEVWTDRGTLPPLLRFFERRARRR